MLVPPGAAAPSRDLNRSHAASSPDTSPQAAAPETASPQVPSVQHEAEPERQNNDQQHRFDAHVCTPPPVAAALQPRDIGTQNQRANMSGRKDFRGVAKFPQLRR